MTQEEKQLLLIDLCARLPYGVHIECKEGDVYGEIILWKITDSRINDLYNIYCCKPYLRPMSSMTDDERKEWYKESHVDYDCEFQPTPTLGLEHCHLSTDWLLKHHFDFRGLIPMGLALEAPEGMYKTE